MDIWLLIALGLCVGGIWQYIKHKNPDGILQGMQDRTEAELDQLNELQQNAHKLEEALIGWLGEKWGLADTDPVSPIFPPWYFDPVTQNQEKALKDMFGSDFISPNFKGKASDLIGLFYKPDQEEIDILKTFKVNTKGICQSEACYRAAVLLSDQDNREMYKNKPASQMQKEMYRFFGEKVPKGLTGEQAEAYKNELEEHESEIIEDRLSRWESFEDGFVEINDPEARSDYGLKKVSLKIYREAYERLEHTGRIDDTGMFDIVDLMEELVDIQPSILK